MLLKLSKEVIIETDSLDREHLLNVKDELQEAINNIKAQLDHAKAEFQATGTYADPKWYASANAALRAKRLTSQKLSREIGKRRKVEQPNTTSLGEAFIKEAKTLLAKDTFEMLMDASRSSVENG